MITLKCIIVEDEPLAAEVLADYIQQTPQLDCIGICPDAIFATEFLRKHHVDVIFLDIHLPKLKGLDFIQTLRRAPKIVVTTAYHQYAVQGFELDVVDYLLKPIEFERFQQAVQRLCKSPGPSSSPSNSPAPPAAPLPKERPYRFFNANRKLVKVYLDDIAYIESMKEYVRLHMASGDEVTTKMPISELEAQLPEGQFLRIHRSFIVNVRQVSAFSPSNIELGQFNLPIGRHYKQDVMERLNADQLED